MALFGSKKKWNLQQLIQVPESAKSGLWKCRVLYKDSIEVLDFQPYTIKKINSVALVPIDDFDYTYKYAERSFFQKIKMESGTDDVLFIKNGLLTDLSYANVCFFDGTTWWTPATPLLKGTRRAQLLARKRIFPKKIAVSDLKDFLGFRPINAMLQFGRTELLPMDILRRQ